VIGHHQYERRGTGPWKHSIVNSVDADLQHCVWLATAPKRPPPDEAEIELMSTRGFEPAVTKGPIREYKGQKCQEWTVKHGSQTPITFCFATEGLPFMVATSRGTADFGFTYDFNKPVNIVPPKM
jgi:hypothetical protein